jgi:translocation and assembly module TamA
MCGGVLVACASRQTRTDQPVVKSLEISGSRAIPTGDIKDRILTQQTGWWPFATKRFFDPVAWQADLERIVRLYAARGYYQAEISKQEVLPKPPDGVALSVALHEGNPTRIGTLDIRGLEGLAEADRKSALERLPVAPGSVFEEEHWEAAKEQIKTRLRNHGYAEVALDGAALVDADTQRAALTIVVRPGKLFSFGEIRVQVDHGARVGAPVIWEQVRLAIPVGRTFSEEAIEEARARLRAMGVFTTPAVTAGVPDAATGTVPVEVATHEAPFRTVKLGGGARVDQARNELRLVGEWSNRDFFGGLRRLTLRGELGWAFIPNIYDVVTSNESAGPRNGPIARLGAEFEQPRLFGRPTLRWRNIVTATHTLEQAYSLTGGWISTGIVWQPRTSVSVFPGYHIEADYLAGAPISSAATAPLTLGCQTTDNQCLVWLSYLEQTVTWDRRRTPLEPKYGFYLALGLQEGGGPLGGNFSYLRVLPDARVYHSFGEDGRLTLSARLKVGELWPTSGVPSSSAVVTRFYAGGSVSMRGFGERRLSPLLLAPAPRDPNVLITIPIGGNGLIDGSFEARYTVMGPLRVAGFVDFGQVTPGLLGASDVAHVIWAVGTGLRYLTAIGPLRADFAYRLPYGNPRPLFEADATGAIVEVPFYPVDESCFGLFGPHPVTPVTDSACVVSVSIGEAF